MNGINVYTQQLYIFITNRKNIKNLKFLQYRYDLIII